MVQLSVNVNVVLSLFYSFYKKNLKSGSDRQTRSLKKLINTNSLSHQQHKHVTPILPCTCPECVFKIVCNNHHHFKKENVAAGCGSIANLIPTCVYQPALALPPLWKKAMFFHPN